MKKCARVLPLLILSVFLGSSALQMCHRHPAVQSETNCVVCKIAHQTPALTDVAQRIVPGVVITDSLFIDGPSSYVHFVFVSHGLSPPALSF
ncbi:MAG: hypothetical protein WC859_09020 [Elusimicrobiota bacterium]|jgi:hypothetical protein